MMLFFFIIISLLSLLLSEALAQDSDSTSDRPACENHCLYQYYWHNADSASCKINDESCICKDPLFPNIIACCLVENCNVEDLDTSNTWIIDRCDKQGVHLPDLTTCDAADVTSTVDTASSTASSSVSSSSASTLAPPLLTTKTSTTKTSSTSTRPIEPTTAISLVADVPTSQVRTTTHGGPTAVPTITLERTTSSTPTSTSLSAAVSSPSSSASSGPVDLAIPLGFSLGLGIPLTVAATGVIAFLFLRRRGRNINEENDEPNVNGDGQPHLPPAMHPFPPRRQNAATTPTLQTFFPPEYEYSKPEMPANNTAGATTAGKWDTVRGNAMELPS